MATRVQLREIANEEGNRLLRIVRRTSGSVVTWRRAQIVLLSAKGMSPPKISEVVVTDISHEGLRQLLREENVRFQAVRTWKRSNDPAFKAKHDRIVELYAAAEAGDAVVICLDEFGPLNLQPQPGGRGWAPRAKPKRIRATYTRPHGVRHLLSAYDVGADRLYGHIKKRKDRAHFLEFCRYIRLLYPATIRLHFILDNFGPTSVPTTARRCANGPRANNVELNRNTNNPRLRRLINTANVA